MKLNRTPEQWAQVKPDAFLDGSIVQARNVIEMAVQDIARLFAQVEQLRNPQLMTPAERGRQVEQWFIDYTKREGKEA